MTWEDILKTYYTERFWDSEAGEKIIEDRRVISQIRKKIKDKIDEVVQKNLSNYGRIVENKPPLPTKEEANRVQGILQRELSAFLPSVLPNTQIKVTFKLRYQRTDFPEDYDYEYVITGKGLGKMPPFNERGSFGQFGSRWI